MNPEFAKWLQQQEYAYSPKQGVTGWIIYSVLLYHYPSIDYPGVPTLLKWEDIQVI